MRKNKLDPQMIRELVGNGLSNTEIASRMGWTVGTLSVRCSQLKISLRRSSNKVRLKRWPRIPLPDELFKQLRQRAAAMGVSTAELVVDLLKEIARDDLYHAVLDRDDAEVNYAVDKHAAVNHAQ
jgi:hypothetical protein